MAMAQVELKEKSQAQLKVSHGQADKIWIEVNPASGNKVVADVYVENDQPVAGGQIPLRYGNGKAPVDVDSVVFDAARAGKFDIKNDGIDSVSQTLRIGFIADISGRRPPLQAGKGKLLSIYFNIKSAEPYQVQVDTVTLSGGYSLLLVDQAAESIPATFVKSKKKSAADATEVKSKK
jgi:hypothetical protein